MIPLSPFYKCGNWGIESIGTLSKITQSISGRAFRRLEASRRVLLREQVVCSTAKACDMLKEFFVSCSKKKNEVSWILIGLEKCIQPILEIRICCFPVLLYVSSEPDLPMNLNFYGVCDIAAVQCGRVKGNSWKTSSIRLNEFLPELGKPFPSVMCFVFLFIQCGLKILVLYLLCSLHLTWY